MGMEHRVCKGKAGARFGQPVELGESGVVEGAQLLFPATQRGIPEKAEPGSFQHNHKRPGTQVATREIPGGALHARDCRAAGTASGTGSQRAPCLRCRQDGLGRNSQLGCPGNELLWVSILFRNIYLYTHTHMYIYARIYTYICV